MKKTPNKAKASAGASRQSSKDGNLNYGLKTEDVRSNKEIETDITDGYDMLEDEFVQDMLQGLDHTITDDYVDSPLPPTPPAVVEVKKDYQSKEKEKQTTKKRKGFWQSKKNKDENKEEKNKKDVSKVDDGYFDIARDFVFRLLDISGVSGKLTGPTEK